MSKNPQYNDFSDTLDGAWERKISDQKIKDDITNKIYAIKHELFGIPDNFKPIDFNNIFLLYAYPEKLNNLFSDLYNKFDTIKSRQNKNDCWNFYDLMETLTNKKMSPSRKDLKFLIKDCKIPERHIHHKFNYFDKGFQGLTLSRYGAYILTSKIAKQLVNNKENDLLYEKMAFARAYFAFADNDFDDVVMSAWDFIRGEKLKELSIIFQSRLVTMIKKFRGSVNYFKMQNLLNNYILNPLFATVNQPGRINSFENIYKQVLPNSKTKSPIPYIAPHIMIFISEQIEKFCDFVYSSNQNNSAFTGYNKLESLVADFFIKIRYQIELAARNDKNVADLFNPKSLFSDYHQSTAFENVRNIENGKGKSHIDYWGILFRDTEGVSFFRDNHLFSSDEMYIMEIKRLYEKRLEQLYRDISTKNKKMEECAEEIKNLKEKISAETITLYGIDIPEFLDVRVNCGEIFSKQLSLDLFDKNENENYLNIEQTSEIKPVNLNKNSLPDFKIIPNSDIIIPYGIPFAATDTGKRYYSNNGEFESINPLTQNPLLLSKSGTPRPVDANFGFCSFLYEMDHLSLEDQIKLSKHLVSLDVINRIVFSGNKSLHMRCTIKDVPHNKSEYRWLFFYLAEQYKLVSKKYDSKNKEFIYTSNILDFSCSNNGRITRRPDIIRPDTNKLQKLLHQTNTLLDINWRPAYQEYVQQQKKREEELAAYRSSFGNKTGPNPKLIEKVKWLLIDWHDGNRHNLLNMGLIPMMWWAGWTEYEIKSVLKEEGNRNLNTTIEKYISNLQKQYV